MKILFGGSFDPFHLGHLAIIKGVIEKFSPEKFIIVPSNASMSKIKYTFPPDIRLKFIISSLSGLPPEISNSIEISEYELRQERPVYSYETIGELKPDALLLGGDHDYTKWKNYTEVIEPCIKLFLVYPRDGNPKNSRNKKEIILDLPGHSISSMEIIERLYANEKIDQMVHHSIANELEQFKLEGKLLCRTEKKNGNC